MPDESHTWAHRTVRDPAFLKSRDPKSIRYSPDEWASIEYFASKKGIQASTLARKLSLFGLRIALSIQEMEEDRRITPDLEALLR